MQEIHDKVCEFISRYKQHIEPQQRSMEIQCVERCKDLIFQQSQEINSLKNKLETLSHELSNMKQNVNSTRNNIVKEMHSLRDRFSHLTKVICSLIDIQHYNEVDSLLYDISEIFDKFDKIPEF